MTYDPDYSLRRDIVRLINRVVDIQYQAMSSIQRQLDAMNGDIRYLQDQVKNLRERIVRLEERRGSA